MCIRDSIKWAKLRGASYMGTMLVYGDYLYNAAWNGKLTCYNALSGEEIYSEKVGKGNSYTASPVAADGIILPTTKEWFIRLRMALNMNSCKKTNLVKFVCQLRQFLITICFSERIGMWLQYQKKNNFKMNFRVLRMHQ